MASGSGISSCSGVQSGRSCPRLLQQESKLEYPGFIQNHVKKTWSLLISRSSTTSCGVVSPKANWPLGDRLTYGGSPRVIVVAREVDGLVVLHSACCHVSFGIACGLA